MSNKSEDWATPQDLFDELDAEFHFTLDPCASESNAKCKRFFTVEDDGLAQSWAGEVVFVNPPYGHSLKRWVRKAHDESMNNGATVVCLLPARTETAWFHENCMDAEIRFVPGRLRFGGATNSAPFPSIIVVFRSAASGEVMKMPRKPQAEVEVQAELIIDPEFSGSCGPSTRTSWHACGHRSSRTEFETPSWSGEVTASCSMACTGTSSPWSSACRSRCMRLTCRIGGGLPMDHQLSAREAQCDAERASYLRGLKYNAQKTGRAWGEICPSK